MSEKPQLQWFGVRSLFFWGTRGDGMNIFEERICVFSGESFDEAFAKAEKEADVYADSIGALCHSWQEAYYQDGDALIDGYEVWSQLFEAKADLETFFQMRYAQFDYHRDDTGIPFRNAKELPEEK
ncbi:MAG: hypothetical protein EBS05_16720 [Proteobacteria bacterium]|nr:hypothetical protein [Pseudomonadota bacterium]